MHTVSGIIYHLSIVAPIIPFPLYWVNKEGRVLGANQACIDAMGAEYAEKVVGKTPYEFYPKEIADNIINHIKRTIHTKRTLIQEEMIQDISTGKKRHYAAIRSPLLDDDGEIICIIGTSVEITPQKEAEKFKLENEAQKTILLEQKNFRKIVGQAVHDIRSPLASLAIMLKMGLNLPEEDRIILSDIATRINDISTNLLSYYRPNSSVPGLVEDRKPVLVYLALLSLLAEKRYQYQGRPINFETDFQPECYFTFAVLEESTFKRMLSNLINNAVEAFDEQPGVVILRLKVDDKLLKISVADNGKGISAGALNKIINNIEVSEEKENGHGIGLVQVQDTLRRNEGTLSIDSAPGKGTTIQLTFAKSCAPEWIAEQILINNQDTVVILDDEPTIHTAWNARFAAVAPDITLVHFTQAEEALAFFNKVVHKERILLLTDYELLKQPYSGLEVIEQGQIKRAVLVTSHYANRSIQAQVNQLGATLLPKLLAAEVPIIVEQGTDTVAGNAG